MAGTNLYAQVILPLAVEGMYTYRVPEELQERVSPGCRVLVSFGKKRMYSAIVYAIHNDPPEGFKAKNILDVLDDEPLVGEKQIQLWDWMSSYYMCTLGEVMRAALPSGLRPESESKVRFNQAYEDEGVLNSYERLLLEVVKDQGELSVGELQLTGISKNPMAILKQLVEMGAVEINEFIRHTVSPKSISYLRFSEPFRTEEALHELLDQLSSAPKQRELVEQILDLTGTTHLEQAPPIRKKQVTKPQGTSGAVTALIKKGVLEQFEKEELGQKQDTDLDGQPLHALNKEQKEALKLIREQFASQQTVLLHGVTSSGKTELYIHLIREMMDKGKQVLYLLPEIALTTQIIVRIRQVFGNRVGVYHSRYSDSERVHVYRNLLGLTDDESYAVVIGVRSAIFLPFTKLGMIIIDEEHENTYKQHDPAPRYHARDTAQVLALFHNARVLMGTATPSFESLYNARNQKFGYVTLSNRYGDVEAPEMVVANIKTAIKRKQMVSHFTPQLTGAIKETLDRGGQIILFQNRRGYSHYIVCNDCGHIPKCERCDVSLTYHRISGKLECHYCGHKENMPTGCPSCKGSNMSMKGFGMEI